MREYSVDPLTMVRVGEVMDKTVYPIPASMQLIELSERIAAHDPQIARHEGMFIVDEHEQLAGIITRGDVLRALAQDGPNGTSVMEAGSRQVSVTFADEVLYEAVRKMVRHNIGRLPVVSRNNPRHIVGYLGRTNLMAGRLRYFEDEYVREGRFLRRHSDDTGNLIARNQRVKPTAA
jgi:chloride channel protein, CIC family